MRGRKEVATPLQAREEPELAAVVLRVGLPRRLLAQQGAVAHELLPRRTEAREIDVHDEAPVMIALAALVPGRHDEAADAPAKRGIRSFGEPFEELRAALLVGSRIHVVDGVVKPERELDSVGVVEKMRDFVETAQAVVDVLERVITAIRSREQHPQLRVDRRPFRRGRRGDVAPPQALETRRVGGCGACPPTRRPLRRSFLLRGIDGAATP